MRGLRAGLIITGAGGSGTENHNSLSARDWKICPAQASAFKHVLFCTVKHIAVLLDMFGVHFNTASIAGNKIFINNVGVGKLFHKLFEGLKKTLVTVQQSYIYPNISKDGFFMFVPLGIPPKIKEVQIISTAFIVCLEILNTVSCVVCFHVVL